MVVFDEAMNMSGSDHEKQAVFQCGIGDRVFCFRGGLLGESPCLSKLFCALESKTEMVPHSARFRA